MKTTSRKNLGVAQIADAIEQGYMSLDDARTGAIRGLLRIREAKTRSLERGFEIARESGDRDSARNYTALTENNERLVRSLKRAVTLSDTPVPARRKDAAAIHGYVWQQRGIEIVPAENVRVAVFGQTGKNSDKKLVETRTDGGGYFHMLVPVKALREATETGELSETGTTKRTVTTGRVVVFGSSGKEPLIARSVSLTADSVSFNELILADDSIKVEQPRSAERSRATTGKRRKLKKR